MIKRYVRRPEPVEAVQVTAINANEVERFCSWYQYGESFTDPHYCGRFHATPSDCLAVFIGDYIVKLGPNNFELMSEGGFKCDYTEVPRVVELDRKYRHFKGGFYFPRKLATDTDTGEMMVVYEDEKTGTMWVRKKEEFLSPVDTEKYPNANQFYRFEECDE